MTAAKGSSPNPSPGGPHLVLYDGTCGLCHGLVKFVLVRDPGGLFHFASLQGPAAARHLAPFGGVPSRLTTVYVITNYPRENRACWVKARAALFLFSAIGWPWRAASMLGVLPTAWLDRGYDLVARNRHRLFGRQEACLTPRPEYRHRFVDLEGTSVQALSASRPSSGS